MQKLAIFFAATLLLLSDSVSMAKQRKAPRPVYAVPARQYVPSGAARTWQAQRMWPGRALCDDGGYRIRPCDMSSGPVR